MSTPTATRTTSQLLLEWDRNRPRSKQREFGMSELGGCRRRAGYRLAGTEPSNAGGSVQAVMGTAVHDAVAARLAESAEPGDLSEYRLSFAGILGTLDRYEALRRTVVDVKTTSSRWLDHLMVYGPTIGHVWQVTGYGAALVAEGREVEWLEIHYLARDTGEEWIVRFRFDPKVLREALAWVKEIRQTPLDLLPRDYEPDSAFCKGCPFLDTCWGPQPADGRDRRVVLFAEDPDAREWARKLWQARLDKADAEAREAEAKGALDAVRPVEGGAVDVGFTHPLEWVKVAGRRTLDRVSIEKDYLAAGVKVPYNVGQPSFRLAFGAPAESTEAGAA